MQEAYSNTLNVLESVQIRDQKVGLMASYSSWMVEINGGGFVPACAPTLKSVQVQREEVKVLEPRT
jgi:hypothetical protein